jgi:Uma2 family endonuclease
MALPLQKPIHLFDYFKFENASPTRQEYVGGRIHAMTGGTMRHNRVSGNIFRMLSNRLDGMTCQVFINDMKLHVQAADSVYYPDVFVYCGTSTANDERVVQDASLVVEVLSESTATIDRREKLAAYQKLPSLRAYWIVSQTEQRIEVYSRAPDGQWQAVAYILGDSVPGEWLGDEAFALNMVYAGTDIAA